MANSPRTQARDAVVKAAEAAQDAQAADGDFAPLDIIRIAADYAARYAVLSGKFGLGDDQAQLDDQLRKEFLARVAHWEDVYLKGGEVVVLSEKPKVAIRSRTPSIRSATLSQASLKSAASTIASSCARSAPANATTDPT